MSALPAEFVGLWERIEITVDGRPISGAGRSWWFQATSRFLDVRAAGGGLQTEMFAGETAWDAATEILTWTHDLDLHVDGRADSGRVEWREGDLIEHGTAMIAGDTIEYSEVWRRREPPCAVLLAERDRGVGRMAICGARGGVFVDDRPDGQPRGGLFTQRSWTWAFEVTIGVPLPSPPIDVLAKVGASFDQFGSTWTVTDFAP